MAAIHRSISGRRPAVQADRFSLCGLKVDKCRHRIRLMDFTCIFLLLLSITEATGQRVWPAHYTDAHLELHRQIRDKTHQHLEDFEVVIPSLVDEDYVHVTHAVRHKRSNRMRRDVADDVLGSEEDGLRYALSGFGQHFRIHLEPNHRLIAPTFSVKRVRRGAEEVMDTSDVTGCHYHGRVTSHMDGEVAMSTCDGLTGLMRTEEDDFLVEPAPVHLNHSFEGQLHPHLIYKRRHLDKGKHRLHYCGKKRKHPVTIPVSEGGQTIKILSNGEIELEETDQGTLTRKRRSAERRSIGFIGNDVGNYIIGQQNDRPESKNVETLIVADRDMIRNHERDRRDVTTYILTVMNMVSGLFTDRTLDGQVNLVLVGIMLLEDNEGLHLDHKADRSLANFCRWQSNLNHSVGRKPDHAVLLTGIDICVSKNSPCETLGLAQIGGMCSDSDSCTINEDMGLGLAFTVAHETGHSFGMKHDGQSNFCSKRDGHIMSPTLNGLNGVFTWSSCSREALRDFLSDASSICLDDHPIPMANLNFPNQLPGEIYDAESQCKWQFGINAGTCVFRYKRKQSSVCKVLWCQREGSSVCETKYMPAAEGTSCGSDMWCRRGVCVRYGSAGPTSVDGDWGEYGSWSACTRTCGGGVQYRKRSCDNPAPRYGGRNCNGKDKIYQLCNPEVCPPSQVSFRAEQCAEFNRQPYRRQYFNWVPFTKYTSFGRENCELLCKAEGYDFFDMLADKVIDGTRCDSNSADVCIQGKCKHVGCDNVLESNATNDRCGVCNGDNSTCETITGSYDHVVRDSGYYHVTRIPRGSRSVRIWEDKCCTHSYIAIRNATDPNTYYLNGGWHVDLYGASAFAGAEWTYDRKAFNSESISTPGPLNEDIIVEVLIVSRNPGISYSYTTRVVDNNLPGVATKLRKAEPQHSFEWKVTFGECSSTCGGGSQTSQVTCIRDDMTSAVDEDCDSASRPESMTQQCNIQSCPARWVTSEWGTCSRTCGDGMQGRQVTCKKVTTSGDVYTREADCANSRKPQRNQRCQRVACPAQWHTGDWSKCSRACGRGKRSRAVHCRSGVRTVRKSACDRSLRPKTREPCLVAYCHRKYQWFISAWDQCSSSCGEGVQRRELKCSYKRSNGQYRPVASRRCKRARKPRVSLEKVCSVATCPMQRENPTEPVTTRGSTYNRNYHREGEVPSYRTARWIAGAWQKCSLSCGGGIQTRAVRCLQSGSASSSCTHHRKPPNRRSCNTYQCALSESKEKPSVCTDDFTWCNLVPHHGQCTHPYFGVKCCRTCSAVR